MFVTGGFYLLCVGVSPLAISAFSVVLNVSISYFAHILRFNHLRYWHGNTLERIWCGFFADNVLQSSAVMLGVLHDYESKIDVHDPSLRNSNA